MNRRFPRLGVEWAVLGFCAWQAADLLTAWQHSPFDRLGWLALGIWLAPTLAPAFGFRAPRAMTRRSVRLCWLGLVTCLFGLLTDMHFLKHGALAFACAAVTPAFRLWGLWLLLALAWMPLLGWLLGGLPALGVLAARVGLAILAACIGFADGRPKLERVCG